MNAVKRHPMFKPTLCLTLVAMCGVTVSRGELLVYEPFDYAVENDPNLGHLTGRKGGLGFSGPWKADADGSKAFIYDKRGNPDALFGGMWGRNQPNWDGVVDNLPTLGGYVGVSDWWGDTANGEQMNSHRTLAKSAGEMAAKNGGVLWLSAVWHLTDTAYFTPVGIALTSNDGTFVERARTISRNGDAIGVGNGQDIRQGKLQLNPTFWAKGKESAQTYGTNISTKLDNVIILKFEFGETDKVSAWYCTEDQTITEAAFLANAKFVTSSIDEKSLNTLAFSTARKANAVDEFRIGTSLRDVATGTMDARQEVKVTKLLYDARTDRYHLTLQSNPGETYGIFSAADAGGFHPCIAPALEAHPSEKTTTFGPFPNPHPGKENLTIKIGLPDLEPPNVERTWGNASTIHIDFTEPMMPAPATATTNYAVMKDGKDPVSLTSAVFHPSNDTIKLTTAQPLEPNARYTVTTRNLTDRSNRPLAKPATEFRTWDNNPKGVKVFILSGQSNMIGRGRTDKGLNDEDGAPGSLRHMVHTDPTNYGHLVDENKKWKDLANVKFWWNRQDINTGNRYIKGNLTVGYGAGPDAIGPEYGVGWALGQHFKDQPVLIIKTAWGGKDLFTDFRSPSAVARRGGKVGAYYILMMNQVREVLDNLDTEFPEWKGKGYQIAGFGWHQGWNDNMNPMMVEAYEANLVDFIKDLRAEFGHPTLPFSIGGTGHGGATAKGVIVAQLAVADPAKHPDLDGTVFCADTRPFWREHTVSPVNDVSHWNSNGESLFLIGDAMGKGLVKMLGR